MREELAKMVMREAHYVEAVAAGDVEIFTASGLQAIPTHRNAPQHLPPVDIKLEGKLAIKPRICVAAFDSSVTLTRIPTFRFA